MNSTLKKLSIFSLAAGVGQMIYDQAEDERVKYRAALMSKAGQDALDKCKAKIDKSKIKQIQKRIDAVCEDKEKFDTVDILSFLLAGLDDLQRHCKKTKAIDLCIKRAKWLLDFFDPKLESFKLFKDVGKRYEEWAAWFRKDLTG